MRENSSVEVFQVSLNQVLNETGNCRKPRENEFRSLFKCFNQRLGEGPLKQEKNHSMTEA